MSFLKDKWTEAQQDRYKTIKGYKLDKWIFQAAMYGVFIYLFLVAASYDFSIEPYFYCPADSAGIQGNSFGFSENYEYEQVIGGCKNPFYKPVSWRNQALVTPGEYGDAPNNWLKFAWPMTFLLFIIAGLTNHYFNNKEEEEQGGNNNDNFKE